MLSFSHFHDRFLASGWLKSYFDIGNCFRRLVGWNRKTPQGAFARCNTAIEFRGELSSHLAPGPEQGAG
jgi:hypothetical protein